MTMIYNKATFLLSAAKLTQLPTDQGAEVAFIGRSNAGKSSAINTITSIKGLARTSKTPGRTQCVNVFELEVSARRLIDLPGYGYAKVPPPVKARWTSLVNDYLKERESLQGLVVVMDIRHPLREADMQLIQWAVSCKLPLHILLTKADKLKKGPAKQTLLDVVSALEQYGDQVSVQLFSSLDRIGLDEAHEKLNHWLFEEKCC